MSVPSLTLQEIRAETRPRCVCQPGSVLFFLSLYGTDTLMHLVKRVCVSLFQGTPWAKAWQP